MFETEISYHQHLFSGSALQIGEIHWYLLAANTKIENKIKKQKTKTCEGTNLEFTDTELAGFGEGGNFNIIHWWIFNKETDIETLLSKTALVLKSVKSMRESPFLKKKAVYESYKSIILDIKNFTEAYASEINELYNYVIWLNDKSDLAPSILFTRKVWRSPRLKYERYHLNPNVNKEDILEDCIEFALGLRDEPFDYTLLKSYYEIDYDAYECDPEHHYYHPTSANHKRIVPLTSNQVIGNINTYFKYVYNSLESIIENISEYNNTSIILPPHTIFLQESEKKIVRVATAQIDFDLSDTFPPEIQDKTRTKEKIEAVMEMAAQNKVNIVCLPELSVCKEWIPEIREQYKDMVIIAGTYYDNQNHNVSELISFPEKAELNQFKITPSELEEGDEFHQGMLPGKKLLIYQTKFGKLAILICRDFPRLRHHFDGNVDLIFVPAFNEDTTRFHEEAQSQVKNYKPYVVISNVSKHGGSSIYGTVSRNYIKKLKMLKYKEKDDDSYKLCDFNKMEEGIIIADFNLDFKAHQVPTSIDPSSVEKPVNSVNKLTL